MRGAQRPAHGSQVAGIQQVADDLFRHLGEENDAYVRPVLINVGNDLLHTSVLDDVLVVVVRDMVQHFQERVVGKGIALGGDTEMHRCGGVPGLAVKFFDPPLLLQHGNGVTEEFPPLRCELYAPVAADKKPDAQLLLQLPHSGEMPDWERNSLWAALLIEPHFEISTT